MRRGFIRGRQGGGEETRLLEHPLDFRFYGLGMANPIGGQRARAEKVQRCLGPALYQQRFKVRKCLGWAGVQAGCVAQQKCRQLRHHLGERFGQFGAAALQVLLAKTVKRRFEHPLHQPQRFRQVLAGCQKGHVIVDELGDPFGVAHAGHRLNQAFPDLII